MQSEAPRTCKVPTVNLGQLGVDKEAEPSQEEWQRVSRELAHALTDVGCAYFTHHGLPDDLLNKIFAAVAAFFKLDDDVKNRWHPGKLILRGYHPVRSEKFYGRNHEMHESFIFKPDDHGPADVEAPPFMATMTPFMQLTHFLSSRLMTAVALSLGKERDYFLQMHRDFGTKKSETVYRFNHYPPMLLGSEDVTGFGAHTDMTTFTLLCSNDRKGLEIRDGSGTWCDVAFVPGTILLMAGDFLHNYSNKQYIAPMHRVVIPAEEKQRQTARYSVGYFLLADGHIPMGPPGDDPSCPPLPNVRDYLDSVNRKVRGRADEDK